jgi:hypothetical protein
MPLLFVADVSFPDRAGGEGGGEAGSPGHPEAGEDGLLHRGLVRQAPVHPPANLRVLPLVVLPNDQKINRFPGRKR